MGLSLNTEARDTSTSFRGLIRNGRVIGVALALVAATLFAYQPVLDNGFVNYDDDLYITKSKQIKEGLSVDGVAWAFSSFQGANWFPLTRLSWMLDVDLFGLEPRGFHASSLAIHCFNVVLLLALLVGMTRAIGPSAFVAAVFALHPLHVESVAWASARKDVLSGAFFLMGLLSHCLYAQVRDHSGSPASRRVAYSCTFACLALGLMAKSILVVLPFALLLLDAWPLGRLAEPGGGGFSTNRLRRALAEKLPFFGLALVAAGVTLIAQQRGGAIRTFEIVPLSMRLSNAVVSYVSYAAKAVWPGDLAVYYPHPLESLEAWRILGASGLILAATWVAWRSRRKRPYLPMGWLWFVGTLIPVIGIVAVGQAALADRYTYLSLIGLTICVAWPAAEVASRGRSARIGVGVVAALWLAALVPLTRAQVRTWRDSTSLFEHALAVTERNHVAHINLAVVALNAREWDPAETHLREALRFAPRSALARGALGEALRGQQRPARALRHFRAALERQPDSTRWLEGLAAALIDLGRSEEAVAVLRGALEKRSSAQLHSNLGLALLNAGDHSKAIDHFEEALRRKPGLAEAHANLGVALLETGRLEASIEHLERSLEITPDLAVIRGHLGVALSIRDGPEAGLAQIEEALRMQPENAKLHAIAARVARDANRPRLAIEHYRAALDLGARSVSHLNNLAWLLAVDPDSPESVRREAVALAEEAAERSKSARASVQDTLAIAYAAAGRWDEAVEAASIALELAEKRGEPELAASIRERLIGYQGRRLP